MASGYIVTLLCTIIYLWNSVHTEEGRIDHGNRETAGSLEELLTRGEDQFLAEVNLEDLSTTSGERQEYWFLLASCTESENTKGG